MGVNKVILVGNVGKDPEIQYVKEDVPVARFTLATNETYRTKQGDKITNTEWHNIVAWRGLAKIVEQWVKKGNQLYIEGKITTRSYEKDNQTKYFTEIVVNNLEMLGKAQGENSRSTTNESNTSSQQTETKPENTEKIPDATYSAEQGDDLPF